MLKKNAFAYIFCALATLAAAYLAVLIKQSAGIDEDLPLAATAAYINIWFLRSPRNKQALY